MRRLCMLSLLLGIEFFGFYTTAEKCNCACPYNYDPVCAVDPTGEEETFPSTCALECYKCTHNKNFSVRKKGECSDTSFNSNAQKPVSDSQRKPPQGKCKCDCPFNYSPLCVVISNGTEETFPNRCSIDCYACTHSKDYILRKQGECTKPSNVGGSDFRNPTHKPPAGKCNCICRQNFAPLCAVNSKGAEQTFPNRCSLDCYTCTHNEDYVVRKQGECIPSSTVRPNVPIPNQNSQRKPPIGKCNCECRENYSPLCAMDSKGDEQTFPNRCALECYKCTHNKDYIVRRQGECPSSSMDSRNSANNSQRKPSEGKCNCVCSQNYSPICAMDSKGDKQTFPNRCALDCYKCTHDKDYLVMRQGECPATSTVLPEVRNSGNNNQRKPPPSKCNCDCPRTFAPLCAVDSKGGEQTFPNQCSLNCYKCTHDKDYVVQRQGECVVQTTVRPVTKCNCDCSRNYNPLCAVDSKGTEQTFANICLLKCYKCTHNKDFTREKNGVCSGTNNTGSTNHIIQGKRQPQKCNCQCSLNYNPVCVLFTGGVKETFPNRCSFHCYACTHDKDYLAVRRGECSASSTARPNIPNTSPNNRKPPASECKCVCFQNYIPLCAVNSKGVEKTFANRCELECSTCRNKEDYVVRRYEACPPNTVGRTYVQGNNRS